MEIKKIDEIIKIFEKSNLNELELEEKGFKMRVLKNDQQVVTLKKNEEVIQAETVLEADNYYEVKSPLVGTFYDRTSPNSEVLVKEGDHVEENDLLCIIEAMKVMNEIKSEVSGTVVKVLVENNSPIEFNQPLFLIEED